MAERMLIVKVKRTSPTQAELYGAKHKFADLRLFDLGELEAVGLDPAALPIGQETPARFWAYYELSDKLNQKGNPYKDVLSLEPVAGPATTTSTDNSVNSRVILVHACSPKVGQPCAPKLGQSCSPILVHLCAPKLVQSCSPELVHDGSGGTPRRGAYCPLHNERAGEGRCPERGRRPWTYGRF